MNAPIVRNGMCLIVADVTFVLAVELRHRVHDR